MKQVILIVVLIFLFSPLVSQGIFDSTFTNPKSNIEAPAENSIIELIGLVERGKDDKIVIIFNPSSRSRISYFVKGDYYYTIEGLLGNYIQVKGYLGEQSKNEWTKEIKVTEIINVSTLPFELDTD